MPHLKVREVLEQVDNLLPNQYSAQQKCRWIAQAEGFVAVEILGEKAPEMVTEETVLQVEPPYDEIYRHYVEAQIHYANGEVERYDNAAAAWNNGFFAYRDFYTRSHPPKAGVKALKFC